MSSKAEAAWVWITRLCAIAGFGVLLVSRGLNAPWGAYILLIGLFFGPDVLLRAMPSFNNGSGNDRDQS
jgi:hypothetical protein